MYKIAFPQRVNQGDLFRDLKFQYVNTENQSIEVTFDFWIVLTQDCDLQQDFDARSNHGRPSDDKFIQTVLVCPAFVSEQLKEGGAHDSAKMDDAEVE